jgi:hypothetical protein
MKMFCRMVRRRCTRKMRLSALSTVSISITAVTAKPAVPIAVRRAAFCVNELICSMIVSTAGVSGRTFSRTKSCSAPSHSSNTGKAVVMASATVKSGTSESSVV